MKEILVFGDKEFKIKVPDDAKITFGPWSPPTKGGQERYERVERGGNVGTLRIYGKTKEEILAVFAGVHGFRDTSLNYSEKVAVQRGDTLWEDDEKGYVREHRVRSTTKWVPDPVKALPATPRKAARKR